MKETRILMDMPITVEIADPRCLKTDLNEIFSYFEYIDNKFSPFKDSSELSKINKGLINKSEYSKDMKEVFSLCEKTNQESNGYFNIVNLDGKLDPSGLVKGWSIYKASEILKEKGFKNFFIDAGGDIQVSGKNSENKLWSVGIRNPFNRQQIVKIVYLNNQGIATSGTYIRGQHIYDPFDREKSISEIVSLTVIGPNVYEADRFATPAFAMGKKGIDFIESLPGLEGYLIDKNGVATMTSGFEKFTFEF